MAVFIVILIGTVFVAHLIMHPEVYAYIPGDMLKLVAIAAVVIPILFAAIKFVSPEITIPVMSTIIYFGILLGNRDQQRRDEIHDKL